MEISEKPTAVVARKGFFPIVAGREVSVAQAGGNLFLARGSLRLTQGGGNLLVAGGDVSIRQGGTQLLLARGGISINEGGAALIGAGGDVSITEGGAAVIAARSVRAERAYVGVALGQDVTVSDDSRVLLAPLQAAIFGGALGLVLAVVTRALRRKGG